MNRGLAVLPPPQGLDTEEISTDRGLLSAIEREAKRLDALKENNAPISSDDIRLISFLANEIKRRIVNLTPEQKQDLHDIREQKQFLEVKRKVDSLSTNVQKFIEDVNNPKVPVGFSAINELEDQVNSMIGFVGKDPERFSEFLDELKTYLTDLNDVKNKNVMLSGFQEF